MKQLFTILLFIICSHASTAQVSLKTEYLGTSTYHLNNGGKSNDQEGSARVYQADITLPVSVSKDSLPKVWGINITGAIADLDNRHLSENQVLSHMINLQVSLFHLRPLTNNWSLLALAGAGLYTAETSLASIKGNQILGNAGTIFIKKLSEDLELGGGAVLNNAFGYPMLFPAFYFNYTYEGRYRVKVSMMNGLEVLAGYTFSDNFSLYFTTQMNAQLALLESKEKEVIFTHQYIIAGIQPELNINQQISVPLTLGINATRWAYFTDRNLKSLFEDSNHETHFGISPYVGIALKLKI